jgi:hypothetical protein
MKDVQATRATMTAQVMGVSSVRDGLCQLRGPEEAC